MIEYDTKKSSFTEASLPTYATIEPVLVADEMVNSAVAMQMMQDYKGLEWIWKKNISVIC